MKLNYVSAKVWMRSEKMILVYVRRGNKKSIIRIKLYVNDENRHICFECPLNESGCMIIRLCEDLENVEELKEMIKEEFGFTRGFRLTPLEIDRLRKAETLIYVMKS